MSTTTPLCRLADCGAPATHVLVSHTYTWHRETLPAEDASRLVTWWKDDGPTRPRPYYCEAHAQERATP